MLTWERDEFGSYRATRAVAGWHHTAVVFEARREGTTWTLRLFHTAPASSLGSITSDTYQGRKTLRDCQRIARDHVAFDEACNDRPATTSSNGRA